MDVAILADAPTLTTGFGRTTRQIATGLVSGGRSVACFGLKATRSDVDLTDDLMLWPAERGAHWTATLPAFLMEVDPAVVFLNMDAFNALECIDELKAAGWSGPIVSYVVFDGLPVSRRYLDCQRDCAAVIASSRTAARYLASEGIEIVGVAPPGVDESFMPGEVSPTTRRQMGLPADGVVVGVFGTNTERKQIPRILAALPAVQEQLAPVAISLYLHCSRKGYWPLDDLAGSLAIRGEVAFAAPSCFDEFRGVTETDYIERIRACDVIVNTPHSGDVEQVILEAQACGVPLVHTDDGGIMAEAAGGGAELVPASDVGVGRTGQAIHHVAPDSVAVALGRLLTDEQRCDSLRMRGFANASSYRWDRLRSQSAAAVAPFLDASAQPPNPEQPPRA